MRDPLREMSGAGQIAPGKARNCRLWGRRLRQLAGRFAKGAQARAEPGQIIIIVAVSLTGLLVLTALVINLGSYFVERRALQNAADAAALAAAGRLAEEHASRSFRDSVVYQAAMTLALQNDIDVGGARQLQAIYTDSDGAALGAVGIGSPFPASAMGVRVTLSGPFATVLSPFMGAASVQARAEAQARLLRAPFPASWSNPVPLAVPLAAFDGASSFDLYDASVAASSYGVAGYEPFLHMAFPGNAGPGYAPADDFGEMHVNLQYWSDGAHQSGTLGLGSRVAIAKGPYGPGVRTGLLDNVRRQGLVDGNGFSYALVVVPLWSTYLTAPVPGDPDMIEVAGFAAFKLLASDIQVGSLRGYFVPYVVDSAGPAPVPGPFWGPSVVALTG